nr:hypothetical protein [uncultured Actinoplanes sp.]
MPESGFNFSGASFSGQQNFGDHNTNTQNNYGTPLDQVSALLDTIRAAHPDPSVAARETEALRGELVDPSPQARQSIESRLRALASSATSTRTVAEAVAAVGVLVAAHWPF